MIESAYCRSTLVIAAWARRGHGDRRRPPPRLNAPYGRGECRCDASGFTAFEAPTIPLNYYALDLFRVSAGASPENPAGPMAVGTVTTSVRLDPGDGILLRSSRLMRLPVGKCCEHVRSHPGGWSGSAFQITDVGEEQRSWTSPINLLSGCLLTERSASLHGRQRCRQKGTGSI